MTVSRQELAAFADGELAGEDKARVAKALAANPDLRRQLEAHRQIKATLSTHYDAVLDREVPRSLVEAVKKGAPAGEVVSFAEARAEREARAEAEEAKRRLPRWSYIAGPALAASLVAVAVFRMQGGPQAPATGGYADTQLAAVLDDQLVADQGLDADTRILLSFRDDADRFCRAYSGASAGIACRDDTGWKLERVTEGSGAQGTDYRQAGSAEAKLLESAQAMAKGDALDAVREAQAREAGWR